MNDMKDIAQGIKACAEAAAEKKMPCFSVIPTKLDGNRGSYQVICSGKKIEYIGMFTAMFLSSYTLYKTATLALQGVKNKMDEIRKDSAADIHTSVEEIKHTMSDEELDKCSAMVVDLMNLIRTVDKKDNPTIVLTRIDGCLQAHAHGAPAELISLLAETMISDEGFMNVATQAADAAITFKEEHKED